MAEYKKPFNKKRVSSKSANTQGATGTSSGISSKGPQPRNGKKRKKPKKSPSSGSSWIKRIFLVFLTVTAGLSLMGCAAVLIGYYYFTQDLPRVDALKNYRPKTVTYIYSDDGRVIGEYSHERRIVVPLAKIPEHVRHAFIAAEDANFYHHPGIDLVSIFRAFVKNIEAGKTVQGGSTITQQVTRSFLLSSEKSYDRKIREAILAYRIENYLTKDEVLYLYLNQIYLGHGAHGIESAAELYFNKHVDQLTVAEAALLAGLTQAPSRYSPFRGSGENARRRQVYTIGQMLDKGFITKEQADRALVEKISFYDRPNVNLTLTPYFTEHVRRMMEELFGEERLYNDGLGIYSTVNIEMQEYGRSAVTEGLREFTKRRGYRGPVEHLEPGEIDDFLARQEESLRQWPLNKDRDVQAVVAEINAKANTIKILVGSQTGVIDKNGYKWASNKSIRLLKPGDVILARALSRDEKTRQWKFSLEQKPHVQSALLCLDNANGDVKTMIGGRDFNESQFNRATQSRRQPGSSFKAVIYTTAMENGFTPGSILIDSPIVYDDFAHGRRWKPTNFDRKFYGPTTLYDGLTSSRNVMAIKLLSKVGYPAVLDMARRMGISSPLEENLSLALGSSGVSLAEMVTAFSTFPNLGERVEPRYVTRVEDRDGRVIKQFDPVRIKVVEPPTACVMQYMLRGVVDHGTGTRVKKLGRPAGGKTGTTNDLADAWFVGFTPEYSAGVWVGLDEMKRMGRNESGGRAAAPIFLYFMQEALKDKPIRDFEKPPGVTIVDNGNVGICYVEGTVGTGYSEVTPEASGDFLKSEFNEKDL